MQAFDELIRVRAIGPYIAQVIASAPSDADRFGAPHTGGDEPFGGDEPRREEPHREEPAGDDAADLYLHTHWSRILHFDLFTGQIDGRDATPGTATTPDARSESPVPPDAQPVQEGSAGVPSVARAGSAAVALVVAAYLAVAGMSHLASPEAAASLGPALAASPALARTAEAPARVHAEAPARPFRDASLPPLARATTEAGPDGSRECASAGEPDTDCIYP